MNAPTIHPFLINCDFRMNDKSVEKREKAYQ